MPGYDDLTPDQIIYIIHVIAFVVTLNVVLLLIKTYFNLRISRFIYFKIEKEIADKIKDDLTPKESFFKQLKIWWNNRKKKKDPYVGYIKPIEEV